MWATRAFSKAYRLPPCLATPQAYLSHLQEATQSPAAALQVELALKPGHADLLQTCRAKCSHQPGTLPCSQILCCCSAGTPGALGSSRGSIAGCWDRGTKRSPQDSRCARARELPGWGWKNGLEAEGGTSQPSCRAGSLGQLQLGSTRYGAIPVGSVGLSRGRLEPGEGPTCLGLCCICMYVPQPLLCWQQCTGINGQGTAAGGGSATGPVTHLVGEGVGDVGRAPEQSNRAGSTCTWGNIRCKAWVPSTATVATVYPGCQMQAGLARQRRHHSAACGVQRGL
ncbi:hypothetical protein V8C86DRAFT_1489701 [Haematococcus lacustris]